MRHQVQCRRSKVQAEQFGEDGVPLCAESAGYRNFKEHNGSLIGKFERIDER